MSHSSPQKANRKSSNRRQLDLQLPLGISDEVWIEVNERAPLIHEVMVIKRNSEGWMGMVAGLHNDREIVAMVFQGPGMSEIIPMIEDGVDRHAGLTHWRPWPTVALPSLIKMRVKPRPSGRGRKARSDIENVAATDDLFHK